MEKPTTKQELISLSKKGFEQLMAIIEKLPTKERMKEWKVSQRDKNMRDMIFHLHAWHELLLHWVKILLEGGKPALPKEGYTWDNLDELNHEIWLEAQKHPLMDTLELFEQSYRSCMDIVQNLTDEQMFKPYFEAMNHPIISLLDGCMADHYQWGLKQLKDIYTI